MARAQDSAIAYATTGYQQVEQLCSLFLDQIAQWKSATAATRPSIALNGAATADRLTALANPGSAGSIAQRSTAPDPSTIEAFEQMASSTRDLQDKRNLLLMVLRMAREAKPPEAALDMADARSKVADYAAYCTFDGIASLRTKIMR